MDNQQQIIDLENEVNQLRQTVEAINAEVYRGNFSARQDFTKYSNFSSTLKVPSYVTLPLTCEVGEIAESGGKLCICAITNSWVVCGTQS